MTETPEDVALIAQAMTQGQNAEAAHTDRLEAMEATIAGSEVFVDVANDSDAIAVDWPSTSSEPPGVSPQPTYSPNQVSPYDL